MKNDSKKIQAAGVAMMVAYGFSKAKIKRVLQYHPVDVLELGKQMARLDRQDRREPIIEVNSKKVYTIGLAKDVLKDPAKLYMVGADRIFYMGTEGVMLSIDEINIDCMPLQDLNLFIEEIGKLGTVEASKVIFAEQIAQKRCSEERAREVTRQLFLYAIDRRMAMKARFEGRMESAAWSEKKMEEIFATLPTWARW